MGNAFGSVLHRYFDKDFNFKNNAILDYHSVSDKFIFLSTLKTAIGIDIIQKNINREKGLLAIKSLNNYAIKNDTDICTTVLRNKCIIDTDLLQWRLFKEKYDKKNFNIEITNNGEIFDGKMYYVILEILKDNEEDITKLNEEIYKIKKTGKKYIGKYKLGSVSKTVVIKDLEIYIIKLFELEMA
jgi:hypothetical protein